MKMRFRILVFLFLIFPLLAHGEEICDISQDPINADTEENPLKDKDYSEEKVLNALGELQMYFSMGDENEYYIVENSMTIINGGYLLKRTKQLKEQLELVEKDSIEYSNIEENYKNAMKTYCDYRKSHFLIDWSE